MNLAHGLLSTPWFIAGYVLFGAVLAWTLVGVDYQGFMRQPLRQHLFFGASIAVMLLWLIRAGVTPGFGIHLLGITALTLLLGWRLAMTGAVLALVGMAVIGVEEWITLGLAGVLLVAVPVAVTQTVWRLIDRFLPANLFIYILGCGFFGAAIATATTRLTVGGLLLATGTADWPLISEQYLPVALLTLFPEGFINGMVIAAFAAYRPDWLATLDMRRYLDR
jgi:uncharacterized membrane protein